MKKKIFFLSGLTATLLPIITVVACSQDSSKNSKDKDGGLNIPTPGNVKGTDPKQAKKKPKIFVEHPYTIQSTYELINFDMLRDADEKEQLAVDANPGKHFISSTNIQTKGSHGDLLLKKVLADNHNTFYLDLLSKKDKTHLSKYPIKMNKEELLLLSKFVTKILLENPQQQKTKRYLPIGIKNNRKRIIDVLNENQKGYEYWNNVYADTPKHINISEAQKNPVTINNLGFILVKKNIASWRWKLLLSNVLKTNDIDLWQKKHDEIMDNKNTWFILNPDYPSRLNQTGKVLKAPIGLTRYEFEIFSEFWTEFYSAPIWNKEVKMILPPELTRHRDELIKMLNKMSDYSRKNVLVVDHK